MVQTCLHLLKISKSAGCCEEVQLILLRRKNTCSDVRQVLYTSYNMSVQAEKQTSGEALTRCVHAKCAEVAADA